MAMPPSLTPASVEFANADKDRLYAEIDGLHARLEAAERALAEERRAFAVWRSRPAEHAPIEFSPQALNDLAETLSKHPRRGSSFFSVFRFLRLRL
jgi:hypothetical protein